MPRIKIQDGSGDRDFFTIVPNYILNHSTHTDQALYLQMKRYAGEDGQCFATQETLTNKLGIGIKSYNKSLNYLIKRGWVEFVGMTGGKTRPIKTYKINNIWQQNNEHYKKIPSERTVSIENEKDTSPKEGDTSPKNNKIPPRSTIEEEPLLRRTKEEEPIRHGQFQNVQLKEKEYTDLVVALNENAVTNLIAELDGYIESTGKKYRSHYATLQNWARRRIQEHKMKITSKGRGITT